MKADYYDPYLHSLLQRPLLVVVIITAVEEEVSECSTNSDKEKKNIEPNKYRTFIDVTAVLVLLWNQKESK